VNEQDRISLALDGKSDLHTIRRKKIHGALSRRCLYVGRCGEEVKHAARAFDWAAM
jgi:hypothetical protein